MIWKGTYSKAVTETIPTILLPLVKQRRTVLDLSYLFSESHCLCSQLSSRRENESTGTNLKQYGILQQSKQNSFTTASVGLVLNV